MLRDLCRLFKSCKETGNSIVLSCHHWIQDEKSFSKQFNVMKWCDGVNKLCGKVSYFKARAADSGFGVWLTPHPAGVDHLNIFTLNQKDWLSVAELLGFSLKGLIGTINKYCCYQERQKHMQHSQVLVICTASPPCRQHCLKHGIYIVMKLCQGYILL